MNIKIFFFVTVMLAIPDIAVFAAEHQYTERATPCCCEVMARNHVRSNVDLVLEGDVFAALGRGDYESMIKYLQNYNLAICAIGPQGCTLVQALFALPVATDAQRLQVFDYLSRCPRFNIDFYNTRIRIGDFGRTVLSTKVATFVWMCRQPWYNAQALWHKQEKINPDIANKMADILLLLKFRACPNKIPDEVIQDLYAPALKEHIDITLLRQTLEEYGLERQNRVIIQCPVSRKRVRDN